MPSSYNIYNNDSFSKNSNDVDHYNYNTSTDSDTDSFLKTKPIHNTTPKYGLSNEVFNSVKVKVLRYSPSVLFIMFIIILGILGVSFDSNHPLTIKNTPSTTMTNLFNNKLIDHLPFKTVIIFSQVVFLFICGCLYSLFNQRMSVPEFKTSKMSIYGFVLGSILTSLFVGIRSLYQQETEYLSNVIGLADNVINCLLMTFALMTSFFSYISLMAFEGYQYNNSYTLNSSISEWVMTFKRVCIGIMGIALVIYIICVILASVYPQQNPTDAIFVNCLIMAYVCSTVIFMFTFSLYILSFRYDLSYIYNLLQYKPDIEYFIDENEYFFDNKSKTNGMML